MSRRLAWLTGFIALALLVPRLESQQGFWVRQAGTQLYRTTTGAGTSAITIRQDGAGNALALQGSAGTNVFTVGPTGVTTSAGVTSTGALIFANNSSVSSVSRGSLSFTVADGLAQIANNAFTIGVTFKVDALPTVGSGFGTSPAVIAGSTPFAGSVNIGTGGAATSGVITWGGTAFPVTPVCTYSTTTTNAVTRGTPTTTQLTLNSTTAWTASDIVTWICTSSK